MSSPTQREANRRWRPEGTGAWYDQERWSKGRREQRDPRLVQAILDEYSPPGARILDAPCGTGRLFESIRQHGEFVGLDSSGSMLAQAQGKGAPRLLLGDILELPFQENSFPTVLCCRLLHHLKTQAELECCLEELMRVSGGIVAGSFWDAHSLAALRRRLPFTRQPAHRVAVPKSWILQAIERAGGEWLAWKHRSRYFSQQTWFVARKR